MVTNEAVNTASAAVCAQDEQFVTIDKAVLHSLLASPLYYFVDFTRLTGDPSAGIFLSMLFAWHGKSHDPDGWVYKTRDDIEAETGLTRRSQETARKKLRKLGLLLEDKRGVPAKCYFRLDSTLLFSLLNARLHDSAQLDGTNAPTKVVQNRPTSWHDCAQQAGTNPPNDYNNYTTTTTTKPPKSPKGDFAEEKIKKHRRTRCAVTGRRIPDLEQIRSWVFGGGFEKSEPMPHPIAGLMRKKFVLGNADIDGFDDCYQRLAERFVAGNSPDYPASWNTPS